MGDVLLEALGIRTAERKAFPGLTTMAQIEGSDRRIVGVLVFLHGIKTAKGKALPSLTTKVQIAELWVSYPRFLGQVN